LAGRLPWHNEHDRIPIRSIREFAARVAKRFRPDRILLFGSYARGNPNRDSDVDLLVVMNSRQRRPSLAIRNEIDCVFPLDLLVMSQRRLNRRLEEGDCFLQAALAESKTLYEAGNVGMDREGRG
jgi:uncharacterized protein